ncbi:MAG: hypothetical protein ISS53_00275 [Dehalococcoidia bacterium]|nr:hypothetical protein [Dehalococcoidia bacterium]
MTTTYQVQVSKPFPRSVQVEPNHYAKSAAGGFVDVAVPEIGFTATVEYTTDAKLKKDLKPLLKAFLDSHTYTTLEVTL